MKNLINKIRNGFTNAMDSFIDSQFKKAIRDVFGIDTTLLLN